MTAAALAVDITPAQLQSDPSSIDRAVVGADPAYEAEVDRIARESFVEITGLRAAHLARLRKADPAAARALAPHWAAWLCLLGAYIAAAGGYAFYFSRAQFDLEVITPVAMGFMAAAALLYAGAALPIRRAAPAGRNVALGGWVLVLLTGAGVGFGSYLELSFGSAPGWLALGAVAVAVILVLTIVTAVVRAAISPDQRMASERREKAFPQELRDDAEERLERACDAVRAAFAERPADRRTSMVADAAEAGSVLQERGVGGPPVTTPGLAIIRRSGQIAGTGIGISDLGSGAQSPLGDERMNS